MLRNEEEHRPALLEKLTMLTITQANDDVEPSHWRRDFSFLLIVLIRLPKKKQPTTDSAVPAKYQRGGSRRLERPRPVTKVQKLKPGPDRSLGRFKQLTDLASQ